MPWYHLPQHMISPSKLISRSKPKEINFNHFYLINLLPIVHLLLSWLSSDFPASCQNANQNYTLYSPTSQPRAKMPISIALYNLQSPHHTVILRIKFLAQLYNSPDINKQVRVPNSLIRAPHTSISSRAKIQDPSSGLSNLLTIPKSAQSSHIIFLDSSFLHLTMTNL